VSTTKRSAAGRPPVDLDEAQLELLAKVGATHWEMAAHFGVTERTIENKLKQEKYKAAIERGKGKGNVSLRRKQMELALKGDRTMLIWLGKQRLGQKEKIDHSEEISTSKGRPKIHVHFVSPKKDAA
jgi:transcriptional antiterminator